MSEKNFETQGTSEKRFLSHSKEESGHVENSQQILLFILLVFQKGSLKNCWILTSEIETLDISLQSYVLEKVFQFCS